MRRWGASLVGVFILVLAGCRSGGDKRPSDDKFSGPDRTGETTGRGGPPANPDTPAHWLDRPKPNWMQGSTPTAPSWNNPKDPGYNLKEETNGLLAGYVEDPEGRKLSNVYITVRESGDTKSTPVGVLSGVGGAFTANGLKANKNYELAVNATVDGRKLFGVVYTKTPNATVRITLLEGEGGTPAPSPQPSKPATDPQPETDPLKKPPAGDIPNRNGPLPKPNIGTDRDPSVNPVGGYETPPPRDDALPKADRFDLMTNQGPLPWKPPVANIPLPRVGQTIPPASPPTRGESRKAEKLSLVDSTGKETAMPAGKLVLVSFYTAGSMASVRAVPNLNAVQEKYAGRGVELVGLGCDDEPLNARVMAADQFRKDHGVKYPLLTEGGKRPGELLKRYGVTELPSAVLLNEQGDVLWQGNPNKPTGLVEAIEAATR